jgi:hypothetical protein
LENRKDRRLAEGYHRTHRPVGDRGTQTKSNFLYMLFHFGGTLTMPRLDRVLLKTLSPRKPYTIVYRRFMKSGINLSLLTSMTAEFIITLWTL